MLSDDVAAAQSAVQSLLHPAVYNHSARVQLLAARLADGMQIDEDALAIAALFHDSGASVENDGPQRFELEGADAAARFLQLQGWGATRIEPVWQAIALHTTAGIAERFGGLPMLVRTAVLIDFGKRPSPQLVDHELEQSLAALPRLDVEKVLAEILVTQALREGVSTVEKAPPASWPGRLVAGHAQRVNGVNPNF